MNHIDLLIKKINGKYFKDFSSKRNNITSEEDLRILFSSLINRICQENAVEIPEEHHEYTVLRGRIDSLYGEVIIEYKEPMSLAESNKSKKNMVAIEQIKRHLLGIEKKHKKNINRFLGVIFDGYKIIFVRRRNNIWDIEHPIVVHKGSFKLLLQRLFSVGLQGKALIIDNLIKDFSILSDEIKQNIKLLLISFTKNDVGKINLLFEQWKILFREVCGYDFDTKKLEMKELLKTFHLKNEVGDLSKIIFAIHTYYALFIKILGVETLTYFRHRETSFLSSFTHEGLEHQITALENGELFKIEGVNNFNEGDFFSWYLLCWNDEIKNVIVEIIEKLRNYDFSSLNLEPKEAKDLIKNIYHYLLPKNLRHSLGEYYTPDWMAEFLISKLNINYSHDVNFLDPTCGSGTFLTAIIEEIKNTDKIPESKKFQKILDSVVGIDLNPLAVISAKTNYLIALSEYLKDIKKGGIDIPIYLSDSLLAPLEFKVKHKTYYALFTKVGLFKIPSALIKNKRLDDFLNLVIDCVEVELEKDDFKAKYDLLNFSLPDDEEAIALEFYEKLLSLQKKGLNGIWAKIIKNIFAPSFFKDFDFIIGNPPWINWQNLPEEYRNSIKKYWDDYKIFLHKGLKARLGSAHDDLCVLLTYVIMDKYLKEKGKLAFVMPQNLFQSSGGGDGFRRFKIKDDIDVQVLEIDDFVKVQPFSDIGASNKPATVIMKKGCKTEYPVKYKRWFKKHRGKIPSDQPLSAVLPLLSFNTLVAEPILKDKYNSSWLIAGKNKIKKFQSLVGHSNYRARKGVDFSLNGLFWGKVAHSKIKGCIIFENEATIGKKKLKSYKLSIETNLVFPILRGKNIYKWKTEPNYVAIIPYSLSGKCIAENKLKKDCPNTYKYFFKKDDEIIRWLESRAIYQKHLRNVGVPIYGLYDIGPYTFSKYKVVWKALASGMIASVISTINHEILGKKLVIPDHNVLMIPFDEEEEAFFLCGILNSQLVNDFVVAYISWFYSSHILEHINIPNYDANKKEHNEIMQIAKLAFRNGTLKQSEQKELNDLVESILMVK